MIISMCFYSEVQGTIPSRGSCVHEDARSLQVLERTTSTLYITINIILSRNIILIIILFMFIIINIILTI